MSNIIDYPSCNTCKFCLEVKCHPWNDKLGKGSMSDRLGYVCLLFKQDKQLAIFMEDDKGSCECHTKKEIVS